MDDLISRKDVITIIENMMFEVGKDLSKSYLLQDARERIIRLNTAFDKAKVIEEILNVSHGYYNMETENEIVEIVEKGGIE